MIKLILITHGNFAEGIFHSAQVITGDIDNISIFSLNPGDSVSELSDNIQSSLEEISTSQNILILTDILGGSPTNIAVSHLMSYNFECLTGLNLPMLLEAILTRQEENLDFTQYVNNVKKAGTTGIVHINKLI